MGRAVDPANPHPEGQVQPLAGIWPVEARELPFRHRPAARAFEAAAVPAASLIAHPGLSNTELQAVSVKESERRTVPALLPRAGRRHRHDSGEGSPPPAAGGDRSPARGGELYAPRFVNNGPPVRRPILRRIGMEKAIRQPVGGLRARNRAEDRRPGRLAAARRLTRRAAQPTRVYRRELETAVEHGPCGLVHAQDRPERPAGVGSQLAPRSGSVGRSCCIRASESRRRRDAAPRCDRRSSSGRSGSRPGRSRGVRTS